MKCKQAVELIDKYLDGQLKKEMISSFQEHMIGCQRCKEELDARKELAELFIASAEKKAPDNFTTTVMEEIWKISAVSRRNNSSVSRPAYPVFRRLGVSMLLTAALMIFSMFIPPQFGGAINSFAAEKTSAITVKTNELSETVTDINNRVKSIIEKFTNGIEKIKEVKSYEM